MIFHSAVYIPTCTPTLSTDNELIELIEFLYIVAYGPIRHNFLFDLTNEISY